MKLFEIELIQNGWEKRAEGYFVNFDKGISLGYFAGTEQLSKKIYFDQHGCTHPPVEEGPAEIHFSRDGLLSCEIYRTSGQCAGRPSDGASMVKYHANGKISELMWRNSSYVTCRPPTYFDEEGNAVSALNDMPLTAKPTAADPIGGTENANNNMP